MRALFIIPVLLVFGACATVAQYRKNCESWVGSSEESLVSAWGIPAGSYTMPNGDKLLAFSTSRTISTYPSAYTTNTGQVLFFGGTSTPMNCVTTFTISDGKVTSWKFQGNDCTAYPPSTRPSDIPADGFSWK